MTGERRQRGQSLVLAAILITVLIGFTGLVVDGGEASAEQEAVRGAADAAALAGVYSLGKGSTTVAATIYAGQLLTAATLPAADLLITYLDAGAAPTAVAASVHTVRAVVTDDHQTFFLGALGIATIRLTATAEAVTSVGGAASCAICLMGPGGTTLDAANGGTLTITGGSVVVDSTAAIAIGLAANASLSAPSTTIATGGSYRLGAGATITPSPVSGSAVSDPFPSLPAPVVAGAAGAYTAPAGASALAPGVYSTIAVPAGATLTLNPGTFVITTRLSITGGTVTGSGVTLYMACATYPTACAVGGSGGSVSMTSGSLTLSPPTSGTYAGLTLFADRANLASSTFSQSTVSVSGTWYALLGPLSDTQPGDTIAFGQLVVATLATPNLVHFTASRSNTLSYGSGGGYVGLTR
jgi:hypothetical protein